MEILILGGGFAGISAANKLGQALGHQPDIHITLIDKNKYTTMLPSLPDVAGGRVVEKALIEDIIHLIPKDVAFKQLQVDHVDLIQKHIVLKDQRVMPYDYLIFAAGSKTNFYGKEQVLTSAHKMDCLEDAIQIRSEAARYIDSSPAPHFVVAGSGFTGIEVATNLNHLMLSKGKLGRVSIVETCDHILPMVSNDISNFTKNTVEHLGIELMMSSEIDRIENGTVSFKDGRVIENAFSCWCAGVMNAIPLVGNQQELRDKRVIVDAFLRIPEHPEVFVAGDSAAAKDEKGAYFRRAVNFAYMQGKSAAGNLIRTIHQEPLKAFKTVDLGWVIPLYTSSIGVALGMNLKGRLGIGFHYIICGVKNYSLRNLIHYFGYAMRFFFTKAPKY